MHTDCVVIFFHVYDCALERWALQAFACMLEYPSWMFGSCGRFFLQITAQQKMEGT